MKRILCNSSPFFIEITDLYFFSLVTCIWVYVTSHITSHIFNHECFRSLRAEFTNSLHQRKQSFGIKIVLSGFTKDMQRRIGAEKAWTAIFAPDLIEYSFVLDSLSDKNNVWEESIKMNHATQFTNIFISQLLVFGPLFNPPPPKKHVLKQAVIFTALGRLCWSWK